jgi:hypothetical protein
MRSGEQLNCQIDHTNESCLLPFTPKGIHKDINGSSNAAAVYLKLLEKFPDDLVARWLLNVAYMSIGQHPEKVPARWLIPPDAFNSPIDFPHFTDKAISTGVNTMGLSGGTSLEDFNNDGFLDIMVSSWGPHDQLELYLSNGTGGFDRHTSEAGLTGITGGLNLVHADYDNDGDLDVLVLRGAWLSSQGAQPNSLLRNNGDATFSDVSRSSGIYSEHPTQTAAWGDYDNDGDLDLFIGNESDTQSHACELFSNQGDGTFTEMAATQGLNTTGYFKGAVWGDVDNDGDQDLYLSDLKGPNRLFINGGAETGFTFQDEAITRGVTQPENSFPTWFWDYDNDGWLDIFATAFPLDCYGSFSAEMAAYYLGTETACELPRLYRNKGDGTFEDVTAKTGLNRPLFAMGSNFGDADNDGYADMYLGTGEPDFQSIIPNVFLAYRSGKFVDVSEASGTGHLQKGHGVAFGDIDNDGDQDVYITLGGAYEGDTFHNALFSNPGNTNNWIQLELEGTTANRNAIGARVELVINEGGTKRHIFRTINSGGTFGADPFRAEIGIGTAESIETVNISWPGSENTQSFLNMPINNRYTIIEGDSIPRKMIMRPVMLNDTHEGDHTHHAH